MSSITFTRNLYTVCKQSQSLRRALLNAINSSSSLTSSQSRISSIPSTPFISSVHNNLHTSPLTSSPEAATATSPSSSSTSTPSSPSSDDDEVKLPTADMLATPSPKVKKIIKMMLELTFIEAHQMVKFMEKEYGVAPMAMAAAPVGAPAGGAAAAPAAEAAAAAPAEEKKEEVKKTSFTIKLEGFDAKDKIKVIKEVRAATGLGLKESKELVEAAPKVIKANMNQADCDALVAKLKEAGAKITIE